MAKTIRDLQETNRTTNPIEDVRTEQSLAAERP